MNFCQFLKVQPGGPRRGEVSDRDRVTVNAGGGGQEAKAFTRQMFPVHDVKNMSELGFLYSASRLLVLWRVSQPRERCSRTASCQLVSWVRFRSGTKVKRNDIMMP